MSRHGWIRLAAIAAGGGLGWFYSWYQTCQGST